MAGSVIEAANQRGHKQHGTAAGHDHHDVERGEYLDESRTVQGLDISALQHQHAIFAGLIVHAAGLHHTGADRGKHSGEHERQNAAGADVANEHGERVVGVIDHGGRSEESADRRDAGDKHGQRNAGHIAPGALRVVENTAHGNHRGRILGALGLGLGASGDHPRADKIHQREAQQHETDDHAVHHRLGRPEPAWPGS